MDPSQDNSRPQFGNRFLTDKNEIFKHNAWDNVKWDEEQEKLALEKVAKNSEIILSQAEVNKLEDLASSQWDEFYSVHQNRFFKDRHWLFTEFPELGPNLKMNSETERDSNDVESINKPKTECLTTQSDDNATNNPSSSVVSTTNDEVDVISSCQTSTSNCLVPPPDKHNEEVKNTILELRKGESYIGEKSPFKILEVGCGVGNTIFPILEMNRDPGLFVYCCDFSETAINIIKESQDYDANRCNAFTGDLTMEEFNSPMPEKSLDIIICIFVLSALHPNKIGAAVQRLSKYLKPGGVILFRDYGRYDMAQLRFKKGRCLAENFYARGDGTRCYFFTQDDVRRMMEDAGLIELQNLVDRRLQVNRGKQLTMYRVWVQAKYMKPHLK